MLKKITIILDPFSIEDYAAAHVEDLCAYLADQFDQFPETAKIYHQSIDHAHDVTPHDQESIERLQSLEGEFFCVIYPAGIIEFATGLFTKVFGKVLSFLMPVAKPPNAAARNTQSSSPNNELSSRSNTPRVNGRIPDIFGTVRSTPDLIAVPYVLYDNKQEVEHCLMCIGRGQYEILDAYDGETRVIDVAGSSVQAYKPNTDIDSDVPYYRVGDLITETPYAVTHSNSVNGQVLRAPNSLFLKSIKEVYFKSPNQIILTDESTSDFTKLFSVEDDLKITDAFLNSENQETIKRVAIVTNSAFIFEIPDNNLPAGYVPGRKVILDNAYFTTASAGSYYLSGEYVILASSVVKNETAPGSPSNVITWFAVIVLDQPNDVNAQWSQVDTYGTSTFINTSVTLVGGEVLYALDGTYPVLTISAKLITLSNPSAINPNWGDLAALPDQKTPVMSPTLSASGVRWIGPFILESTTRTRLFNNFVALNGLYKDDGNKQTAMTVQIAVEVTPVNSLDVPVGAPETFTISLTGSANTRDSLGVTLDSLTALSGRCSVRAHRVTGKDLAFKGAVVDEVKWKDIYAASPIETTNFGNVTIVRTRTYATAGALAVKERKLNMLVTRQIPRRESDGLMSTQLYSSLNAADVIAALTFDQNIGNRGISEIDLNDIYTAVNDVAEYFGTPDAASFCYTFDKDNLSFEESISIVATAVFCTAYRRGNVLRLSFELPTEDSTLLFNHSTKVPNCESRTLKFGVQDDFDGVELQYVDPADDAIVTYYVPEGKTSIKPKKIETVGIRNKRQAHFQAWRVWNRLQFQRVSVEFGAMQEADLLVLQDRILVADNTRTTTQDGEIISQSGLVLETSQALSFEADKTYTVFLQLPNGTVDSINASAGADKYHMIIDRAPLQPLALASNLYVRTIYILVPSSETHPKAFLVTERSSNRDLTCKVSAVNYDARYYERDKDLITGLIA